MEVLTHMLEDAANLHSSLGSSLCEALQHGLGLKVRIVGGSHYSCGHELPQPFEQTLSEAFLEVKAPPDEGNVHLSDLLVKHASEEKVDLRKPRCGVCGIPPQCCEDHRSGWRSPSSSSLVES